MQLTRQRRRQDNRGAAQGVLCDPMGVLEDARGSSDGAGRSRVAMCAGQPPSAPVARCRGLRAAAAQSACEDVEVYRAAVATTEKRCPLEEGQPPVRRSQVEEPGVLGDRVQSRVGSSGLVGSQQSARAIGEGTRAPCVCSGAARPWSLRVARAQPQVALAASPVASVSRKCLSFW